MYSLFCKCHSIARTAIEMLKGLGEQACKQRKEDVAWTHDFGHVGRIYCAADELKDTEPVIASRIYSILQRIAFSRLLPTQLKAMKQHSCDVHAGGRTPQLPRKLRRCSTAQSIEDCKSIFGVLNTSH